MGQNIKFQCVSEAFRNKQQLSVTDIIIEIALFVIYLNKIVLQKAYFFSMELWSWRVGLGVRTACCSCRGPESGSSTHVWWITTIYNSLSRGSYTLLFWSPPDLNVSVCIFTHRRIHKNKMKIYKNRWDSENLTWKNFSLSTLFPE